MKVYNKKVFGLFSKPVDRSVDIKILQRFAQVHPVKVKEKEKVYGIILPLVSKSLKEKIQIPSINVKDHYGSRLNNLNKAENDQYLFNLYDWNNDLSGKVEYPSVQLAQRIWPVLQKIDMVHNLEYMEWFLTGNYLDESKKLKNLFRTNDLIPPETSHFNDRRYHTFSTVGFRREYSAGDKDPRLISVFVAELRR
jgi:hypothetical protein